MAETADDVANAEKELNDAIATAKSHGSLNATSTTQASKGKADSHMAEWNPSLVMKLSSGVAIFAILVLALTTVLMLKKRNAEQVLRTFGILIVIFAAVFLVIAGYSDTQITPVIGLLGTIAGYLLGRRIEPTPAPPPAGGKRGGATHDAGGEEPIAK